MLYMYIIHKQMFFIVILQKAVSNVMRSWIIR